MSQTQVPSNPNIGVNRAPRTTELSPRRELIRENEIAVQTFDGVALQPCASTQNRYDEQIQTLKSLEEQKATAESDVDASAHPILRCNDDVLRYIFEWATGPFYSSFQSATRLSHVCRRFRHLTLQMPKLWTSISINVNKNPDSIMSFWDRSLKRLAKRTPPSIELDLTGSESEPEIFKYLSSSFQGQYGINHIRRLEISLYSEISCARLAGLQFGKSTVDHLILDYDLCDLDPPHLKEQLLRFLRMFDKLPSLDLCGIKIGALMNISQPALPYVKNIVILSYSEHPISLTRLTQVFPNVETAELSGSFMLENTNDKPWPLLQSLYIGYEATIPWSLMEMPNITSLSIDGEDELLHYDEVPSFIVRNSSLRHVSFRGLERYLPTIFQSGPDFETVTVSLCASLGDPLTRLNKIQELRIICATSPTQPLFDQIVKKLLNRTIVGSTKTLEPTRNSVILRILINPSNRLVKEDDLKWINSSLALENVTEIEVSNWWYKSYNFKYLIDVNGLKGRQTV